MAIALTLLNAVAATGPGAPFLIQNGGDFTFAVNGTFGGTSVALEMLGPDGVNYINCGAAATMTTAGMCTVSLPAGTYRASVTGGAAMSIYASLKQVG